MSNPEPAAAPVLEPTIAAAIGAFAAALKWDAAPDSVRHRAKLLILDAFGIAIAANRYPFASAIRTGLSDLAALDGSGGADGGFHVIGSKDKLPLRDAIIANGALVHGLDFDDTHMASVIHATAVSLPVALSVGEAMNANGAAVLSAYLTASEVAIRIGLTANFGFHKHGLHATGVAGHFSSAVAAGKLFGLNGDAIAAAQGIVGSTAMASQEFVADGAWNKRFHPGWAGVAGVTAAKLAQNGFVAPKRPYEGRYGIFESLLGSHQTTFDIGQMTAGLGVDWHTEQSAIKPFPTCHFTHAPADCALILAREHDISPEQIDHIEVRIPADVAPVIAEPRDAKLCPVSDYDAKFSVQFIVAAALHRRRFGLLELDEACLKNPEILKTASKVRHIPDPESTFPKAYSGGVTITLKSGERLMRYEPVNRGAGDRALREEDVVEKFIGNVHLVINEERAEEILKRILNMENESARSLMRTLSGE
jgi:2-methylcitrate dehydratase PrpD